MNLYNEYFMLNKKFKIRYLYYYKNLNKFDPSELAYKV